MAENLLRLQELSESPSRVEVIRKALSLLDIFLECREEGGKVVLQHANGTEETLRLL